MQRMPEGSGVSQACFFHETLGTEQNECASFHQPLRIYWAPTTVFGVLEDTDRVQTLKELQI